MKLIAIGQLRRRNSADSYQFSVFYNNGKDTARRVSPRENNQTGFPVSDITRRIHANGSWGFSLELIYE